MTAEVISVGPDGELIEDRRRGTAVSASPPRADRADLLASPARIAGRVNKTAAVTQKILWPGLPAESRGAKTLKPGTDYPFAVGTR
jgi:hypothetical protein